MKDGIKSLDQVIAEINKPNEVVTKFFKEVLSPEAIQKDKVFLDKIFKETK